jgi:glycosyltransferase involved in cell wall biosynthesis
LAEYFEAFNQLAVILLSVKNEDNKLSVIIPCFNESPTIKEVVHLVRSIDVGFEVEIIVIDDFSTDGSQEIIRNLHSSGSITKFIFRDRNYGKGAALREGFKIASGSLVIVQDGDLECDPREYPKLLDPILKNQADVVYGSRFLSQSPRIVQSFRRTLANRFLTNLSNLFTDFSLTDMETCYKAFKREVLNQIELKENRFGFEPEVTAKISKLPIRVAEVAISYNPRTVEEGKKIGFKDGVRAIWVIIKYR